MNVNGLEGIHGGKNVKMVMLNNENASKEYNKEKIMNLYIEK